MVGLLRAGQRSSDYLYGYLAGRGYGFRPELPRVSIDEHGVLRGIGAILLKTYQEEKKKSHSTE